MTTRIDAIRARLAAATKGPWKWDDGFLWNEELDQGVLNHDGVDWDVSDGNATLVAHAPEDIAYLLERVGELEDIDKVADYNIAMVGTLQEENEQMRARIAALEEEASRLRKAIDRFVDRHGYETYWQAVLDENLSGSGEGG